MIEKYTEIDKYFTEYDDAISGESFRDPLGMQIIWSALGQRIFGWHITSRANNLRNYTHALFHHFVVKEIESDETIEIPKFSQQYYRSKDDPRFKKSMIIFLENLFVYTAVLDKFDCSGILGSQSAGNKLRRFNNDPLIFIHEDAGILVRQISLGLNGGYKTPLMQRGILDGDYRYPGREVWAEIENRFNGWDEALELKELLKVILKMVFSACSSRALSPDAEIIKPYRELTAEALNSVVWFWYSEIAAHKEKLSHLYRVVVEKREASRNYFGEFWKEQLGLNTGAARAIFDSLSDDDPNNMDNEALFQHAVNRANTGQEKEKIKDILAVEPLMAFMVNLFNLLCYRENRHLEDIANTLARTGSAEAELERHWGQIDWERARQAVKRVEASSQTAARRLEKLLDNQPQWNMFACLKNILSCHKIIMEERGLYPWVTVDDSGKLRHTGKGIAPGNWRYTTWVHDYYLGSVKNIFYGLNGNSK